MGSNISTVDLRVVGGDEKGTQCRGVQPSPAGWRSPESERVKYGHESRGTLIREWLRWRGPVEIVNVRPILSSKRILHKDYNRKCLVEKNSDLGSQWAW
jgi:hypothetical protein